MREKNIKKPKRVANWGEKTLEAIAVTPDSVTVTGGLFIFIRPFGVVTLFVVILRMHVKNIRGGEYRLGWRRWSGWCGWAVWRWFGWEWVWARLTWDKPSCPRWGWLKRIGLCMSGYLDGPCMINKRDGVRCKVFTETFEGQWKGRHSKFLHLIAHFHGFDICHEIWNQREIEVWVIDILNLAPINESLNEGIEIAQVILKVFDACRFSFGHSQRLTLGLEPEIGSIWCFESVDQ